MKHTPGPWFVALQGPKGGAAGPLRAISINRRFDLMDPRDYVATLDASEADGVLMAAAPELLAVLSNLEWAGMTNMEEACCPECSWEPREGHKNDCALAAALARATGGKR